MILRVKNLGRARLGNSLVHRAMTVKSLGSIRLVMPGALVGMDGRLDTAETTHQRVYPCPLKPSRFSSQTSPWRSRIQETKVEAATLLKGLVWNWHITTSAIPLLGHRPAHMQREECQSTHAHL